MFVISPKQGLCKVGATGLTVDTGSGGSDLRMVFERIAGRLATKYGDPEHSFDFLQAGSIWREPNEWMMALKLKERVLANSWTGSDGVVILLQANALSSNKGWVSLSYEFPNFRACTKELETAIY
jgi:hypothetical protein